MGEHVNVRAFDWDTEARFGPFSVHFCAVQHWSARGLYDRNRTLWGSWALLHPQLRFWFSGDLGYSQDTRDIGPASATSTWRRSPWVPTSRAGS